MLRVLGYKSMAMTLRYAHLSQEHKKKAVNLLNGLTAGGMSPTCHKSTFLGKRVVRDSMLHIDIFGGAEGARTPDLMTARQFPRVFYLLKTNNIS